VTVLLSVQETVPSCDWVTIIITCQSVASVAVIYTGNPSGDPLVNITVLERFCEVTGVLNIYFMNLENS